MAAPAPDVAISWQLNSNSFAKCAPAIGTNIRQCGTVTICNMKPLTADDLTSVYQKSGQFRVMKALLQHDMELKMCAPVQNGLYDFLMANKVDLHGKVETRGERGIDKLDIIPFVLAKRYHPINNEYWIITNGTAGTSGAGENPSDLWSVQVSSQTGIPADVRSFPPRLAVYCEGMGTGGTATRTAWTIVSSTLSSDGTYVTLVLEDMNRGAHLASAKSAAPVNGLLVRGTPNVHDAEQWCAEAPAYRNWTKFPFFFQTIRNSFCWSEHYQKWRKIALENDFYREWFDMDEVEVNKQLAVDHRKRFVQSFFRQTPISNFQTAWDYDKLDPIPSFNRCVGYRANATGVYDQLAECHRVWDMQGSVPSIADLAILLYNMMRVREGRGHPKPKTFDLFTDSVQADAINTAFLGYYKSRGQDMLRINVEAGKFSNTKTAEFGFQYTTFQLFWPQGVTINVITHEFFDDWNTATAAAAAVGGAGFANFANTSRVWWILDWTGIYPGIIASNRVVNKTGDLKNLASINPSYACVMKVYTQEQTLTSMTYTVIVDCPASNAIIENIGPGSGTPGSGGGNTWLSGQVVADPVCAPVGYFGALGAPQDASNAWTTTTSQHVYTNAQQTATWSDGVNTHTVTIPAGEFHSSRGPDISGNGSLISADANALALEAATALAAEQQLAASQTVGGAEPSQTTA